MRKNIILLLLFFCALTLRAAHQPQFSTAGFFSVENTGREVFSMNPGWRFLKGSIEGASQTDFNDKNWNTVSLPNGIETLPLEASGCVNYQGEVWYRKHFTPEDRLQGKKLFLHFEAIMGKCKVWVNGELVKEHFGGFLPVIADITSFVRFGKDNVIAVWADNSDDPSYPPGKAQNVLDFAYFGGIYRDAWLIAHNDCYITDANYENETAGGGLFVSFGEISEKKAEVNLKLHLRNEKKQSFSGKIVYELYDASNKKISSATTKVAVNKDDIRSTSSRLEVKTPHLWSPESPYLYYLHVLLKDQEGNIIDGYMKRVGIRSVEFKGEQGFWLNGKPYGRPLMGANRHQDFAVVGNALTNSMHWRDAKKLRDAGLKVIRNAHYPQDPSFMDACDELGLFVIVNTPGWQFWNEEPIFAQRVYSDIRNMVRRDRNHPSVWMWEPILNETHYPMEFAKQVKEVVEEEFPYPYCYCGCDASARGSEYYKVLFAHPQTGSPGWGVKEMKPDITYFTREWGDNVDDWNSHNSTSRVNRLWGEIPMLIQAQHYANSPDYKFTNWESLFLTTPQHVGGTLWHSFDHQRGYHPDPFFGGLMDAFRQPKYSYYMFMSQRDPQVSDLIAETGPMVYIAHEMTPFSPKDVTVYSNCDEVRLTVFKGGKQYSYKKDLTRKGMPSPVITFKDVYYFMDDKALARKDRHDEVYLLAEALVDGKVVATHKVVPARRPSKIQLSVDNEEMDLMSDGSDIVTVIASITDDAGNIKRLNDYYVTFSVEGEGTIVGNEDVTTNPRVIQWGTAPILVRSTTRSGQIKVKASVLFKGENMPLSGELILESKAPARKMIYNEQEIIPVKQDKQRKDVNSRFESEMEKELNILRQELNRYKLKEVEKQQTDFGGETL